MQARSLDFLWDPEDPPSKRNLLSAALTLFAEQGVQAVNVRAVAERAGYTNPALFKFFPTKDALGLHLFERCYLELGHALARAVRPNASFDETFHELLSAQDRFVQTHPAAWFFLQEHARLYWARVPTAVSRLSSARLLDRVLRKGIVEGAVDESLDVDVAVAALMGAFQQFARARSLGGLRDGRAPRVASLEALLRRMLAPSRSRSKGS